MRVVAAIVLLAHPCLAQVRTDGSVGPKQALGGPNFAIPHTLGKQAGGNLFHSFEKFDVKQGEVATFSGPGNVKNVLARVTDGQPTVIFGTVRSTIAGADLYLMNSHGVVFGAGAQLDVSGSVTATSADYVRLGAGARFNAIPGRGDALVSAAPEAFGFLKGPHGNVAVVQARLTMQPGKSIALVSGADVILRNGIIEAPGGKAHIFATRSPGEVRLNGGLPAGEFTDLGDIAMLETLVNASADTGGAVAIRGRDMFMADSLVVSETTSGDGRDVEIGLSGLLQMRGSANITVNTNGAGAGGALKVSAGDISIEGTATTIGGLSTNSKENSGGSGGTLTVNAKSLTITRNGFVAAQTGSSGDAGAIRITAGTVVLDGAEAAIIGTNRVEGSGDAAKISVIADSVTLTNGGQISALGLGTGSGGSISIDARQLHMAGTPTSLTAIQAFALLGTGGNVDVRAGDMSMAGGQISVETIGPQRAGNINIEAGTLRMIGGAVLRADTRGFGAGGNVTIDANRVELSDQSTGIRTITAEPLGGGPGGNLRIDAGTLTVCDGAALFGGTGGSGTGGRIDIRADDLLVSGDSIIFAGTTLGSGGGPGGTLNIMAGTMRLADHGIVSAGTLGDGAGGRADIRVGRLIIRGAADDSAEDSGTGIAVGSLEGSGDGGNLLLRAGEIDAVRGIITAGASASGDAGSVTIRTGTMRLRDSSVATGADSTDEQAQLASGNAGTVSIKAARFISLREGSTIRATAEVADAGSIVLDARSLYLNRSAISAEAAARGGSINLTVARVLLLFRSEINAEGGSQLGDITIDPIITVLNQSSIVTTTVPGAGGNISLFTQFLLNGDDSTITAAPGAIVSLNVANPDTDISGAITPINAFLADNSMTLVEDCTRWIAVEQSSFLLIGRGANPVEPGGFAPARD